MPAIWTDPSSRWRRGPRRSNRCRAACAEADRRTARRGPRSGPQPGQGVSRGRYSRVAARKQERRPGRQASDVTGSGRRRRRGPAPAGRGAGTGERVDAGGGGGVRLFQGKVRVPQDQGHAQDRRLGEGAPQNHSRGWSDGACSLTTRVRLMRGRGHAGSRRPRRPRFHGWDAEREMARGHHPGSGPGMGRACLSPPVDCRDGRIVACTAGPDADARRQDARQGRGDAAGGSASLVHSDRGWPLPAARMAGAHGPLRPGTVDGRQGPFPGRRRRGGGSSDA